MKNKLFRTLSAGFVALMVATVGFAQSDSTLSSAAGDLYLISAKAGGVNYVEGRVSIERLDGTSGPLVKGNNIEVGNKIKTSRNSRAEVLLNPGSFLRVAQNSEFEFLTTSLDDLRVKVNRGTAMFEVFASDDFKVTVTTPRAKFYLTNTGVYRIDVLNNGVGKIEVHRGKAQVGSLLAEKLKKGRTATVDGSQVNVSKFNRGNKDSFEVWSKSRAKLIAKANKKLSRDRLSNSLLSGNRRYNCFDSLGLWVFSRRYNSFSFLPYGFGWRSPYGFGFRTNTSICNNPYYYSRRPFYGYPRTGGSRQPTGGSTTPTSVPQANVERASRNRTPPFRRMERSGNVKRRSARRSSSFPSTRSNRRTRTTTRSNRTTKSTRAPRAPRSSSPSLNSRRTTKN